jgi:Xaa-Pro dipeptidase
MHCQTSFAISRRNLIGVAAALPLIMTSSVVRAAEPDLSALRPMTDGVQPIGRPERAERLTRAQSFMRANGIGAVLIEPGSSLVYFTGISWGRSERALLAVLPVEGEPCIISPFFEEPRMRETLAIPAEVRVWQEDEDPLALVAGLLRDRKLAARPVGIEESVRYFIPNALGRALPGAAIVSANPVVRRCRMIKTAPEIALMQRATDITVAAYRWIHPRVEKGMTGRDIGALMTAATVKLGGDPEFSMALIGEAAAYPHGTQAVHRVDDGQIVLMDCGCAVDGYQSDVSRTFVSAPPARNSAASGIRSIRGSRWQSAPRASVPRREVSTMPCGDSIRPSAMVRATSCPASRTVPVMASVWTATNRSTLSTARRRRLPQACAFPTSRASTFPANSASGWRTAFI